jgi:hypothetical protein
MVKNNTKSITNSSNKIFLFSGADLIISPDEDVVDCQIIDGKSASEENLTIDSNKLSRKNFLFKRAVFLDYALIISHCS